MQVMLEMTMKTYSISTECLLELWNVFSKSAIFAPQYLVRFGSVSRSLFGRTTEITEMPIFGRTEKPNRSSVVH